MITEVDQLVIGCRRRDATYHALISHYAAAVYTFLLHMTGRENTDGLFPEIWLRVHNSAGLYKPEGNPVGFIFGIVHETASGYYREAGPGGSELKEAIESLPPEIRTVFLLRHAADIPYKMIGRHIGLPLETVLKRMNAALDALKGPLEQFRA